MTGAILGDVAGSRFEFSKPSGFNYKKVELFGNNCFFTDDTVLTGHAETGYCSFGNGAAMRVSYIA